MPFIARTKMAGSEARHGCWFGSPICRQKVRAKKKKTLPTVPALKPSSRKTKHWAIGGYLRIDEGVLEKLVRVADDSRLGQLDRVADAVQQPVPGLSQELARQFVRHQGLVLVRCEPTQKFRYKNHSNVFHHLFHW